MICKYCNTAPALDQRGSCWACAEDTIQAACIVAQRYPLELLDVISELQRARAEVEGLP